MSFFGPVIFNLNGCAWKISKIKHKKIIDKEILIKETNTRTNHIHILIEMCNCSPLQPICHEYITYIGKHTIFSMNMFRHMLSQCRLFLHSAIKK